MRNTLRSRGAADQQAIVSADRTAECTAAWEVATRRLSNAHPGPDGGVPVFPNASDGFWAGCVTGVPPKVLVDGRVKEEVRN